MPENKTPTLIDMLLKLIYPPRCYICRHIIRYDSRVPICDKCDRETPAISGDVCGVCGRPSGGRGVCRYCDGKEHLLECNYALFKYEGAPREIICNFKYYFGPQMIPFLTELIANNVDLKRFHGADYIVPVPLHKNKLKKRGFNQAEYLAGILSGVTGIPLLSKILIRKKDTASQSALNRKERKKNTKDAFDCVFRHNLDNEIILSKVILLVDDIYTTGSTMEECAKALLRCGSRTVKGFTFCVAGSGTPDSDARR